MQKYHYLGYSSHPDPYKNDLDPWWIHGGSNTGSMQPVASVLSQSVCPCVRNVPRSRYRRALARAFARSLARSLARAHSLTRSLARLLVRSHLSTLNGHTHWQGVTGEAVNPEYLDRRFDSYEDEFLHQKPSKYQVPLPDSLIQTVWYGT